MVIVRIPITVRELHNILGTCPDTRNCGLFFHKFLVAKLSKTKSETHTGKCRWREIKTKIQYNQCLSEECVDGQYKMQKEAE
jgi:hypothetical protein